MSWAKEMFKSIKENDPVIYSGLKSWAAVLLSYTMQHCIKYEIIW